MTSRERVLAALNHNEPDRVPLDIGGTNNTCMHIEVERAVKKRLGLTTTRETIAATMLKVVLPDESIMEYFAPDCCCVFLKEQKPWVYHDDGDYYTDAWGIGYKLNPDGYYFNFCKNPLSAAQFVEDIEKYECPQPSEYMMENWEEMLHKYPDKCSILDGLRSPMFSLPSWIRGEENFYCDLISDDGMLDCLLDKVEDTYIRTLDFIIDRIGNRLDIIKFADDLGAQNNLLLSPEIYRKHIKPRQEHLYQYAKKRTGCKILLHSCGAVSKIIGDLIEIGVDALNPVQISAAGMEPEKLKKEFGSRITFWGGGIDTQHTLMFATPLEVKREVASNIKAFKSGGGYVFAQVHNIMPGTPIDNILAMYEAYYENAGY